MVYISGVHYMVVYISGVHWWCTLVVHISGVHVYPTTFGCSIASRCAHSVHTDTSGAHGRRYEAHGASDDEPHVNAAASMRVEQCGAICGAYLADAADVPM